MNAITNETTLKRQGRILSRKSTRSSCMAPLSIIAEEDDPANLSSSSSTDSRAALKSRRRRANIVSDSFHLTLTQVSYSFPQPPNHSCPSSPSSSCSSFSSSPCSSASSLPTSPEPWICQGDDDDVPKLSCTKPLVINKRSTEECADDLEEDYHYYTQEFNKIISLASLYSAVESHPPRPESVCTINASRSRPRSLTIVRPPPRISLPVAADIDDDSDVLMYYISDSSEVSSGSVYSNPSPVFEQEDVDDCSSNISLVDFEFEMDPSVRLRLPLSLPCSPIDLEADIREGLAELRAKEDQSDWSFEEESNIHSDIGAHTLKSKWSTSTLGSVKEKPSLASKVLPYFSPSRKSPGTGRKRGFSFRTSMPSTPSSVLFPPPPRAEGARIKRRGSTSTNASAESGDSNTSSGLRRKPIPLELFLKA